ncbi:hypothetical protein AGDE_08060 [Angomonas deanei]|uniref:DUF726-domain-containing protein n=1 Tax=Angomonas deanei TaxID=59799 RepID=A0A7G2CUX6_9TRYP|nr:hypothetical protein AGDE_08060 [Angomonas deanei]CAD2222223.1 Protein of unknown function (DUF726), putative [Angomonas deanei]|eukprot:EPY34032.1 hypothetical protein AGDE_08060 [Angomonas deanei]
MTAETGTGELQEEVLKGKDAQKSSLKRVATIGGFALLGGTALVLTGGLAAPLVGPAFAALVTATTATLGAIGSVGGAILGGGAIAAAFAAIVGVATHTAALLSIFTPVLTAANVTAVFGVSGVALGGYKGFRRTKDSDIFMIRSVDEVETFKDAVNPQGDEDALGTLSKLNQAIVEDDVGMLDIPSMLEDSSRPGITVPSHTRFTAMSHTRNIKTLKKRFRSIVFAVDCQIDDFELHLTAIKLISGVWTVIPPTTIKNSQSGIFACMNRFAHPTGTGFIVCYTVHPQTKTSISRPVRVWLRVNQDFVGGLELSAFCEGINHELNPFAAEFWLESHVHDKEFTQTVSGLTLEVHAKPFSYLKVYASELKQRSSARQVTFPIPEFPQKLIEYNAVAKQRRKISVSVLNRSQHSILVRDLGVYNGNQWSETSSPMRIQPGEASLTLFTNASWSLEGAEGYYIFELLNDGANPVRPRYFIRLQFEVSALNNVNLMLVGAPTFRELKQMEELHPEPPQANEFEAPLMNGLFFSVSVRVTQSPNSIQLHVKDFVERTTERVQEKASLTVGVCGYSTIFDPRRPMQDQQVGLWQSPLRSSALLGVTEGYVVHWEDEFLMKFGETIKVDLQVSDQISKKAVKTVKKAATKKLLQGALFSGFHAFKSFMGAFSLPLYGVWAADLIDNNYATLVNRADFTGKDLAASLLDPNRGNRPVTLIGYSFGCRVIAECLVELDRLKAYGIVENAYLMGATFAADSEYWAVLRRVVAGRLVNVFTRGDFVLWLLYKVNEGDLKPMGGVTPINVPGVENVDASPIVSQHSEYAVKIQDVLDYIPFFPTADTWKPKTKYGSPGIVVSLKDTKDTVKKVGLSLVSVLSTTPYCSFGIRNMVLSDDVHF